MRQRHLQKRGMSSITVNIIICYVGNVFFNYGITS